MTATLLCSTQELTLKLLRGRQGFQRARSCCGEAVPQHGFNILQLWMAHHDMICPKGLLNPNAGEAPKRQRYLIHSLALSPEPRSISHMGHEFPSGHL